MNIVVVTKNIDRFIVVIARNRIIYYLIYSVAQMFRRFVSNLRPRPAADPLGPRLRRDAGLAGTAVPDDRMALLRARAKPPI